MLAFARERNFVTQQDYSLRTIKDIYFKATKKITLKVLPLDSCKCRKSAKIDSFKKLNSKWDFLSICLADIFWFWHVFYRRIFLLTFFFSHFKKSSSTPKTNDILIRFRDRSFPVDLQRLNVCLKNHFVFLFTQNSAFLRLQIDFHEEKKFTLSNKIFTQRKSTKSDDEEK